MRIGVYIGLVVPAWFMINAASAQHVVRGVVMRSGADTRVSQAFVVNRRNRQLMMTDELGMFSVTAVPGDTLIFSKSKYLPDTLVVQNRSDVVVYLQPVNELNGVTVRAESKRQELNAVMQHYSSKGIYNEGKSLPVWQFVNSPLTGLYNLFGKGPAQERRFAAFAKNELEADAVRSRYTKDLVKRVTGLPDTEAAHFMQFYTPSYQNIHMWNDYQLIMDIKRNLVYFRRSKAQRQQLPKLGNLPAP